MQVIAVIADLVASRKVPQRAVFQRKVTHILVKTSERASSLASPYTLTLGDEFQAVYRKADSLLADVIGIMAEIHPVRARFALSVGDLTTRINPEQALGMDGPVFHQARAALSALKEDGCLLRIAGTESQAWGLSTYVLNLLSHQLEMWSRNRLLILEGLLRGKAVREIEDGLQISRVAIYKNIRAAALDDVVGICHELTEAMGRALRS